MNNKARALKAEIIETEKKQTALAKAAIKRLGTLAMNAGLNDTKISDAELRGGLEELAARFQRSANHTTL